MKFSNRKRRQAPTIIIISLIDILIVVLIFMMVSTTFKQQPVLKLVLPETKQAKQGSSSEESHNLIITVAKQEPYFYLGNAKHAVTSDRLKQELAANAARDPQISVVIWADTGAPFGQVLKASDVATDAVGLKNVRVAVKRPGAADH